jgi:hypothetical protein
MIGAKIPNMRARDAKDSSQKIRRFYLTYGYLVADGSG